MIRTVTYTPVKASTNTADEVVVVWDDTDVRCHDGEDYWPAGKVPEVWDTTGLGSWDMSSWVQCGACGAMLRPRYEVLRNPGPGDVEAAVRRLEA